MNGYLLDTPHCSLLVANNLSVVSRLHELGEAPVATCSVVGGELFFGAEYSERIHENLSIYRYLLRDITVFPVDEDPALIYGRIKAAFMNKFGPQKRAAVAVQHQLVLIGQDKHFKRIAEIEVLSKRILGFSQLGYIQTAYPAVR